MQIFAQDQSISNIKDSLSVVKGEFSVCFSVEKFTSWQDFCPTYLKSPYFEASRKHIFNGYAPTTLQQDMRITINILIPIYRTLSSDMPKWEYIFCLLRLRLQQAAILLRHYTHAQRWGNRSIVDLIRRMQGCFLKIADAVNFVSRLLCGHYSYQKYLVTQVKKLTKCRFNEQ